MSHFKPSRVEHEGRVLELAPDELDPLVSPGDYWHGVGSPSTWLAVSVFTKARSKYPGVPNEPLLALAGAAMGITAQALRGLIEWNENYMRWHDGDDGYKVL